MRGPLGRLLRGALTDLQGTRRATADRVNDTRLVHKFCPQPCVRPVFSQAGLCTTVWRDLWTKLPLTCPLRGPGRRTRNHSSAPPDREPTGTAPPREVPLTGTGTAGPGRPENGRPHRRGNPEARGRRREGRSEPGGRSQSPRPRRTGSPDHRVPGGSRTVEAAPVAPTRRRRHGRPGSPDRTDGLGSPGKAPRTLTSRGLLPCPGVASVVTPPASTPAGSSPGRR